MNCNVDFRVGSVVLRPGTKIASYTVALSSASVATSTCGKAFSSKSLALFVVKITPTQVQALPLPPTQV